MAKLQTFQQIRQLTVAQQGVLAAWLCERMVPNYQLFSKSCEFGDAKVLRGALDAAWLRLSTGQGSNWERWQEKLEEVTPSDQQFDVLGVYPAIAACTALSSLLQGLAEQDSQALLDVAKISQSSVAHFIELTELAELPNHEARQAALAEHELYLYEVANQQDQVAALAQARVDKTLVREVRQQVRAEGHSNLGFVLPEAPTADGTTDSVPDH